MEEIEDYYEEILNSINQLQNEAKFIDKSNLKAITKLDRKARNIEQALHSYDLNINNDIENEQIQQDHMNKLKDLQVRYNNIMTQITSDPTLAKNMTKSTFNKQKNRFNTSNNNTSNNNMTTSQNFVPILPTTLQAQQPASGNQYGNGFNDMDDINLELTTSMNKQKPYNTSVHQNQANAQNYMPQQQPHQSSYIQAQQLVGQQSIPIQNQQQQNIYASQSPYLKQQQTDISNIPMQSQYQNPYAQPQTTQQGYYDTENINSEDNFNLQQQTQVPRNGKIEMKMKNIIGGNFVGRKCAVKECYFQTEVQCYKCRIWVCKSHFYKDSYYKKNAAKFEQNGIDIIARRRCYCRNCGYQREREYKGYQWAIACCFCALIVIALLVMLMTYLDLV